MDEFVVTNAEKFKGKFLSCSILQYLAVSGRPEKFGKDMEKKSQLPRIRQRSKQSSSRLMKKLSEFDNHRIIKIMRNGINY